MDYLLIKQIHVTCVVLSGAGFLARGVGLVLDADWMRARWVGVLPHVVDTVLLASAIALALMLRQYPFVHGWLTAKVLALIAYIVLGTIALRRARSPGASIVAWLLAIATFGYIVSVARTKNPLGFLSVLL